MRLAHIVELRVRDVESLPRSNSMGANWVYAPRQHECLQ